MVKIYFAKRDDNTLTYSINWPIKEDGTTSYHSAEFNEEDIAEVVDGTKDFSVNENGEVVVVVSDRKDSRLQKEAEKEEAQALIAAEKEVLKDKLQNGTATDEDIKAALLKLL